MKIEAEVPEPFIFNALKHHRDFVRSIIRESCEDETTRSMLAEELNKLGNLMTDVYLGALDPVEICRHIAQQLWERSHFTSREYDRWINAAKKRYQLVRIDDDSRWTMLSGREDGRYIHIHPARYSSKTVRIRAMPFKTAVMILATPEIKYAAEHLVEPVNAVRKLYFGESPLKDQRSVKNILKTLAILQD